MKRIALLSCVLISLLFFLLSGCSHADAEPQISSFTDFETKYKRASFSELIDNPSTFLSDFSALNSLGWGAPESCDVFLDWNRDDDMSFESDIKSSISYKKDGVLFNEAVSFRASVFHIVKENKSSFYVSLFWETGDLQKDYSIAKSLASSMFEIYGNASSVKIDDEDATEHELRQLFNSSSPKGFEVDFNGSHSVTFYCFKLSTEDEPFSSFVSLYSAGSQGNEK